MSWFDNFLHGGRDISPFVPLQPDEGDDDLRTRVNTLCPDEAETYKWLREGYSIQWTAETMLRNVKTTRLTARRMYNKLGVRGRRELIRAYGVLDKLVREPVEPPNIFDE